MVPLVLVSARSATGGAGGATQAALSAVVVSVPASRLTPLYRPDPGVGVAAHAVGALLLV